MSAKSLSAKSAGELISENMIVLILALMSTGLFLVLDATTVKGDYQSYPYYYFNKQLTWDLVGISAFAFVYFFVDLSLLRRFFVPIAVFSLAMLLAVLFFGQEINGARRWFRLGFLSFQPSELAKLGLIIFFARLLEKRQASLCEVRRGLLPVLAIVLTASALLAAEPDIGNAVMVFVIMCGMIFIAGARLRHVIFGMLGLVPAALVVLFSQFDHFRDRIMIFLDPASDIAGKGYQQMQALIALGSGGLLGKGPGNGMQKLYYLPEAHNDFIFAIAGEDFGLAGTSLIVLLYGLLIWFAIRVSSKTVDMFSLLLSFGIIFHFAGQALINLGVVTRLLPNKGMSLPLISYGGSNVLFTMIGLAILVKIARNLPPEAPLELGAVRLSSKSRLF